MISCKASTNSKQLLYALVPAFILISIENSAESFVCVNIQKDKSKFTSYQYQNFKNTVLQKKIKADSPSLNGKIKGKDINCLYRNCNCR